MSNRLQEALVLLGYENAKQLHHKHGLVSGILLFAGLNRDTELEKDCEAELERIRIEVVATQADKKG